MKKVLIFLSIFVLIISCDKNPSKSKNEVGKFGLKIISPNNGSTYNVGEKIEFKYNFDNLPDTCQNVNFWWRSNLDDYFSGDSICIENKLSKGNHIITIEAMENYRVINTDTISISIDGFYDLKTTELYESIPGIIYNNYTLPIKTDANGVKYQYYDGDLYYTMNRYKGFDGAKYWKNGDEIILSNNESAKSYSIFIDNGDIYNCGIDKARACYWKNDDRYFLSDTFSVANDICVYDGDVYIAGYENFKACYWLNGEKFAISENYSEAKYIKVVNNTIYIGGEDNLVQYDYGVNVGWYWIDGVKTNLFYNDSSSNIEYSGSFNDMIVDQKTVYITGRDNWNFGPVYWENDKIINLKPYYGLYTRGVSYSIYKLGEEIVIGGNIENNNCGLKA